MELPLAHSLVLALALLPACDSTNKGNDTPGATKADVKATDAKAGVVDPVEVIDESKNAVAGPETKAAFEGKTVEGDTKVPPAGAEADERYTAIPGPPDADGEVSIDDETRQAYEQLTSRPAAPAPATVAKASEQLEAWLTEPVTSPVPALLLAAGDIELAVHCGPCDDHRLQDLYKTSSAEQLGQLVSRIVYEGWSSGGGQKCDERCCTFEAADNMGSGATNVEKICMAVDAAGKPTAYTRIEAANQ
jgi:hypothetical protein